MLVFRHSLRLIVPLLHSHKAPQEGFWVPVQDVVQGVLWLPHRHGVGGWVLCLSIDTFQHFRNAVVQHPSVSQTTSAAPQKGASAENGRAHELMVLKF